MATNPINAKNILSLILVLLIFSSCETEIAIACLKPSGEKITETFTFDEFTSLSVAMDARVQVFEGEQEVTITAAQNVLDKIESDSFTVGDQLNLEIDGCTRKQEADDIEITVFMSSIEKLAYLGDGSLETPDELNTTDDLKISSFGDGDVLVKLDGLNSSVDIINAGDGDMTVSGESTSTTIDNKGDGDVDAEDLISDEIEVDLMGDGNVLFTSVSDVDIFLAGDGRITGFGSAINQEMNILGDGRVFNFELNSENAEISISGDGRAEVKVENSLDVTIAGDGRVCFKGQPEITLDILGDGRVDDCN